MNDSILQYKENIEDNTSSSGKKSLDPFAEFYRQMEEKYAYILSGDDPHEYTTDICEIYDNILYYNLSPQELDDYLTEYNGDAGKLLVISDVKAAIADCIGDMLETYRYESTEEGQAIEGYIDQLLTIVNKHEIETQKMSLTDASFSKQQNQRREGPKAERKKPYQDSLFS